MENIKCIFLDLGGTFREVNENPPYSEAARARIQEICTPEGCPEVWKTMTPSGFYNFINGRYDVYREWALTYFCEAPEEYLWSRWLVPELDFEYVKSFSKELTYEFRSAKGERLVVPGGVETVRELNSRGYKVGIISDLVGTVEIDEWLDKDGIRDLFATVQQSSVTMLRKPHPGIYYLAMAEAGVKPWESVFVGDNLKRDIIGAKASGFAGTVAVDYPATPLKKITVENQPSCVIKSFPELLKVFPGNGLFLPEAAEIRGVEA